MHLFQDFVDVDAVGFLPPPLPFLVDGTGGLRLGGGLLRTFAKNIKDKRCVRLPESGTGMGRITGMDYRNGLLYAALSTSHVFYMRRIAYSSH